MFGRIIDPHGHSDLYGYNLMEIVCAACAAMFVTAVWALAVIGFFTVMDGGRDLSRQQDQTESPMPFDGK